MRLLDLPKRWRGFRPHIHFYGPAVVMLMWPAIYNGAPLVFSDTIAYAAAPARREVPDFFSPFYGLLIYPLHLQISLWPVLIAQALMVAHLLRLTARTVLSRSASDLKILSVVAALCALTGLPWFTTQIMPDVFTGVVALGIFLLVLGKSQLKRSTRTYLIALTTVAVCVHLSHVPLAILSFFLAALLGWRLAGITPRVVSAIPVVLGPTLLILFSVATTGQIALAKNGNVFLLAKLIAEGPAYTYLESACPEQGFRLCPFLTEMRGKSADELKWSGSSPLRTAGTTDELELEARKIVPHAVLVAPGQLLGQAALDVGRQLTRFQIGDALDANYARMTEQHLREVFGPATAASVASSKQANNDLPLGAVRVAANLGLAFGIAVAVWAVVRPAAFPTRLVMFAAFVLAFCLLDAVVTGALSGPYDRYLARAVWLISFAGFLLLLEVLPWGLTRPSVAAPGDAARLHKSSPAGAAGQAAAQAVPQPRRPSVHVVSVNCDFSRLRSFSFRQHQSHDAVL